MTAGLDPVVARALALAAPSAEVDAEEVLRGARAEAARLRARRRRRRRALVVVLAAVGLLAGAAVAASKFDLIPFLGSGGPTSASFSIDPARLYSGPAPAGLACPAAGAGAFVCTPVNPFDGGRRRYLFSNRVERQPALTRQSMLDDLQKNELKGLLGHAEAQRLRDDVGHVGADFIRSLSTLLTLETVASGQSAAGQPGMELAPPPRVPAWIACEQAASGGFRCHDLAARENVAVGTPIYLLQTSTDWYAVPRSKSKPPDIDRLFETVLGRQLTSAEVQLLLDVARTSAREEDQTGTVITIETTPLKPLQVRQPR